MSGYSSQAEVREVIKGTLRMNGLDPRDYSVAHIMREGFTSRGAGYGYGSSNRALADWDGIIREARKGGAA